MKKEKTALFWKKVKGKVVQCKLCPRFCVINERERGNCGVRENQNGKLVSLVYGKPCAANVDPLTKKPIFHMLPGSNSYSIGTAGCNLACKYCQNWEISQTKPEDVPSLDLLPEAVVEAAILNECKSVAYTYTEPVATAYEYVFDTAKLANKKRIKNVEVSNGFINQGPLKKLLPLLDAANIDFKGDNDFYKKIAGAWAKPVQETLIALKRKKVWLEVTNLIVPTLNDSAQKIKWLVDWILDNLGEDVPLHFSAFWPTYKLMHLPSTSLQTLKNARRIAMKAGLLYVYTGNLPYEEGNNTYCPRCGKVLIKRSGFYVIENLLERGKCPCGEKIAGVWK